jgi:hypothetical protein
MIRSMTSPHRLCVLLLLATTIAACSSSSNTKDSGGQPPSDTGAKLDTASPADTAAPADTASADRNPGADVVTGTAVVKFCNSLVKNMMTVELAVELGMAPAVVRLAANTGQCSSALGAPCTSIPAGSVAFKLLDGTTTLRAGTLVINPGDEVVLIATVTNQQPDLAGGVSTTVGTCSRFNPSPDGGVPAGDGGADAGAPPMDASSN